MTYVVCFKLNGEHELNNVVVSSESVLLNLCYTLEWSPGVECFRILDTTSNNPEVESVKHFGWGEENYTKFRAWQEM